MSVVSFILRFYDLLLVAIRCSGLNRSQFLFFPGDAFARAGRDRLLDAVLVAAFGKYDSGFFTAFIHLEDIRAQFNTAFTPDAAFLVQYNCLSHGFPPLLVLFFSFDN
jgi:hypothetical protein